MLTYTTPHPLPLTNRAQVTGPDGKTEFRDADSVTGKFSFTADDGGSHSVCLTNLSPHQRRVELMWAAGVGTIDYADMAKKEQLKPLEVRPFHHALPSWWSRYLRALDSPPPPPSPHSYTHTLPVMFNSQLELRKL